MKFWITTNNLSMISKMEDRAVGFLVGQIMKATKGQANPGVVNKLLKDELAKR